MDALSAPVVARSAAASPSPAAGTVADARVVLGMPHLSGTGLSEQWLLKECGHRHWQMLAAATGRVVPDFVAADGAPIYAAFTGLTVEADGFADCGEHDVLTVRSRLARVGRGRVFGDHLLSVGGRPVGRVGMTSVFVRRTRPGVNASVVRAEVPGLPPPGPDAAAEAHAAAVAALAAPSDGRDGPCLDVLPCPPLDFNGAGFLYFASYVAFADRAEWALAPDEARRPLRRRTVRFLGNVDVGEALTVELHEVGGTVRAVLRARSDRRMLAVAATDRSPSAR